MSVTPLNCYRCGRFVGKDGDPDLMVAICDAPSEIGYPRCARCLNDDEEARSALRDTP